MKNIYICPKCSNLRSLSYCEGCNFKIKTKDGVYDFLLDDNYKNLFDEIGNHYYQFDHTSIQEEIVKEISKIITIGNVLDLGCGDGNLSTQFLKYDCYNLICIDSSYLMLEKLSRKLENLNYDHDRLTIIRADAINIPLANESIDIGVANNLFHLLDDPIQVLQELYRVLSATGKFIQISNCEDNTYEEYGKDLSRYYEIVNLYNEMYWDKMKTYNYYPKRNNTPFNIHLEAKKLFKGNSTLISKSIEYSGKKTIKDFIFREYSKSDYSKVDIPTKLHLDVHQEIANYLISKFTINYQSIEINYKGTSSSIIDVYNK